MKRSGMWMSSLVVAATLSTAAYSLTHDQSEELRRTGRVTISDDQGHVTGHYEVSFMPGSDNVLADGGKQWSEATALIADLNSQDFWTKHVYRHFTEGLGYFERGIKNGVGQIPADFQSMLELNRRNRGGFGYFAGVLWSTIKFGGKAIGRTLFTIGEGAFGAIYTVVTPTSSIMYRPIAAGTKAILAGTMWPVARYTWNGLAWVTVANSAAPTHNDMFVTFVPEHLPTSSTGHGAHSHDVDDVAAAASRVNLDSDDSADEVADSHESGLAHHS